MNVLVVLERFNASHAVASAGGPEPVHGHSWALRAEFAVGSGNLAGAADAVAGALAPLENLFLNDIPRLAPFGASAEALARFLHRDISSRLPAAGPRLLRVAVEEEPGCRASYFDEEPV